MLRELVKRNPLRANVCAMGCAACVAVMFALARESVRWPAMKHGNENGPKHALRAVGIRLVRAQSCEMQKGRRLPSFLFGGGESR